VAILAGISPLSVSSFSPFAVVISQLCNTERYGYCLACHDEACRIRKERHNLMMPHVPAS
jgi:hypothetical protein